MAKIITDLKNYEWRNKSIPGIENAKPVDWALFRVPVVTKEELEDFDRFILESRREGTDLDDDSCE